MHGELTKKTDSAIILIHNVFGELEIPIDQIASVTVVHDVLGEITVLPDQIVSPAADKPQVETVVLLAGDAIHGLIAKKTDSSIILFHKVLRRLEIPKNEIASITFAHDVLGEIKVLPDQIPSLGIGRPEVPSPEEKRVPPSDQPQQQIEDTKSRQASADRTAPSAAVESEKQKPEEAPVPDKQQAQKEEDEEDIWLEPEFDRLNAWASKLKKQKWSFAVDFSIDTTSGENEESTTRIGAHIKRKLPRERLAVDISYYNKVSDGEVTDNKFTAGAVQDWLNPGSRWFFFGAGRYDFDEFESWEQRANFQLGPGYNLIKSENMLLDLRFGAGGRKEWGSQNNDLKFEGLAGVDFKWKLSEKQTFDASVWYFPVLTDTDDYRTRSTLNWRYRLARELNLSLLVGLLHEFRSIADPGDENDQTRTYVGLQVEF